MKTDELLPCPFCGSCVAIREPVGKDEARYIVHMDLHKRSYCPVEFSDFNMHDDLITAWNTRPKPYDETTHVLVPIDATKEMIAAGEVNLFEYLRGMDEDDTIRSTWAAMIAATKEGS